MDDVKFRAKRKAHRIMHGFVRALGDTATIETDEEGKIIKVSDGTHIIKRWNDAVVEYRRLHKRTRHLMYRVLFDLSQVGPVDLQFQVEGKPSAADTRLFTKALILY